MKRYILFVFAIAFGLTSCVKENFKGEDQGAGVEKKYDTEFSIIAENSAKTILDGDIIKWASGDQIAAVFTHPEKTSFVTDDLVTAFEGETAEKTEFKGSFSSEVKTANGYEDNAFAVYPHTAVDAEGNLVFDLPASQTAVEGGSFQSGYNLASAALSLSEIEKNGTETVAFKNALTYFRVNLHDAVKSVKFTGTSPLTGVAPLKVSFSDDNNQGRLLVNTSAEWTKSDNSVTLGPENGAETFQSGGEHRYNILVWPGTHTSLTITLDYGGSLGTVELVKNLPEGYTFGAAKYYNLNFPSDPDEILSAMEEDITIVEADITEIEGDLDKAETDIANLLSQIQSVSYLSDYTENVAYAGYTKLYSGVSYLDLEFDYLVRPASAAQALVDACKQQGNVSEVFKMIVDDKAGNISEAAAKSVSIDGDVLSVKVATPLPVAFYDGNASASMALQISDGHTEHVSDVTNMLPRMTPSIVMTKSDEVPVMMDATVSIPFKFGANDASTCQIVLESEGFPQDRTPSISQRNNDFKQGYVVASFKTGDDLSSMKLNVKITEGSDEYVLPVTFSDAGKFNVAELPTLDYPGGEINVSIDKAASYGNVTMTLSNGSINTTYETKDGSTVTTATYYNTWIYEKVSGVQGSYQVDENAEKWATVKSSDGNDTSIQVNWGVERTANINFSVKNASPGENGDLTYTRSVSVTQKAYGTSINQDNYYSDGEIVQIRTATSNTNKYLNLVILGDGYTQANLQKSGYFYGRANNAADVFMNSIDEDFRDRFNVYVVMRQSANSGVADDSTVAAGGYTYYQSFRDASVNVTSTGLDRLKTDVKSICSESSFDYYRTVAILLINTNINGGATGYVRDGTTATSNVGDGYKSFAYSFIPANSTGTGGLIRHEAVGHGLGRLGDEYYVSRYTTELVNEIHSDGFYRNIATNTSYWSSFSSAGYTADEVGYYEYSPSNGLYRSTNDSGIMFDSQQGKFNAVSRWVIYERIRKQTEGSGDYWNAFLEWDKKNR